MSQEAQAVATTSCKPVKSAKRLARDAVTFEGGLNAPFHRWFRLTPSFSPDLVEGWLNQYTINSSAKLLDPFSGAGTTCIVGKQRALDVVGFEINPLLAFVSETSLNWAVRADDVADAGARAVESTTELLQSNSGTAAELAEALGTNLPPIHNVGRWWRDDVLRELVALKYSIDKHGGNATKHLILALAQIVYSTANITLGRLQVAFVDRSGHNIEVLKPFAAVLAKTVEDLAEHVPSEVRLGWLGGQGESRLQFRECARGARCTRK